MELYNSNEIEFLSKLSPTYVHEYVEWLRGYLKNKGKITHRYDYNSPQWYTTYEDLELIPLYGAQMINIIVQPGVKITGKRGHSNVYYMDDFRCDNSVVPFYNDCKPELLEILVEEVLRGEL